MDVEEFRCRGKEMVDFICEYVAGTNARAVFPAVSPGFLRAALPERAPEQPEDWTAIMRDVTDKLLPGVTHWQHSAFHAYFPYGASFPSLLGELLADAFGSNSFSWTSCPSSTELEMVVMDWLCKAMDLPAHFLSGGGGGGVLSTSASEAILCCMLAARERGLRRLRSDAGADAAGAEDSHYLPRLVAYCSEESHSSVEKAAKICMLRLRRLPTDAACVLRGDTVRAALAQDRAAGLLPAFVSVTLGSTSTAAFDDLRSVGPACAEVGAWLHVDAAYAGSALICPEMRGLAAGLEHADSFNVNPYKWLLTGADCACLWVRDAAAYCGGLIVDPLYLEAGNTELATDRRHWGVPLTRKFRSLKLWFVIRRYGLEGLRSYQRNHMALAKHLEALVREDSRFEVTSEVRTGLVCFRLRTDDALNRRLLVAVNTARRLRLTPTTVKGRYVIRFCVNHEHANRQHIEFAWNEISKWASKILCGSAAPDACAPVPGDCGTALDIKLRLHGLGRPLTLPRSISLDCFRHLTRISLPLMYPIDRSKEERSKTTKRLDYT